MSAKSNDKWYYIVVQDPGSPDEQFMGYEDKTNGMVFIPAFASKEEATQCFMVMPKDIMKHKYEVQAIIKDDLTAHASKSGYKIFLLDDKGQVVQEIR